jgi:NADH-quinone oxidoreductase subunit C
MSDTGAQNAPKGGHEGNRSNTEPIGGPGGTGSGNPNMAAGEATGLRDAAVDIQLSPHLAQVRDHVVAAFPESVVSGYRGELTIEVAPHQIVDVLDFCKTDPDVACEMLSDLSGVHWPAGKKRESAQETTGWPAYEIGDEAGRIEIDYIVRSLVHNHWFRIRANVPDEDPRIDSVVGVYGSANYMEREAYDFFGVTFTGHPDLRRILMPDEWSGHPHRKDYPLGGVEVQYKGATIPPPDQRTY